MPTANWYPDPADDTRVRWWDGERWTEHTQPRPAPVAVVAPPMLPAPQYPPTYPPQFVGGPVQQSAPTYAGTTYAVAPPSPVQMVDGKPAVAAYAVSNGWGPTTCVRHRKPAVATRPMTFLGGVPGWTYILIVAGLLVFAIVASVVRKKVKSPAWPLCADCMATRRRCMILVAVGIGGIIPVLVLANAVDDHRGSFVSTVALFLALIGLPLLALVAGALGSWAQLVGGKVTQDGLWVVFRPGQLDVGSAGPAVAPGSGAVLPG